jgi:hypothetical protein
MKWRKILWKTLLILICILLLTQSVSAPKTLTQKVRQYTGRLEFNYFDWTVDSLFSKMSESSLGISDAVETSIQHDLVLHYFDLVKQEETLAGQISQIYTDPSIKDPQSAAATLLTQQENIQSMLDELAPMAEEILQQQVSQVLADNGLSVGGQLLPALLYHTTPLPKALIVSPRDVVRQDVNISLLANLTLDQINQLENKIAGNLDVSVLVVDIGGVGIYPTMVEQTSDSTWVMTTIAHEWTHNYLTLRPLGLNYDTNNQLRTMNETTAEIVGSEIGAQVVNRFYPELKSSFQQPGSIYEGLADANNNIDTFDFNGEMHETRVVVDQLLQEGKITEAENYMELRRQVFVAHGYLIRKLNQAYFAFYGAYAQNPVGAAGADPVGPAVRALRAQSSSLADFLNRISWMSSFDQLEKAVKASD